MWEGLLPLGSVVKLKKAEERVMIMGVSQSPVNMKEKLFDYAGILYPYGYQDRNAVFLFNKEDVEKIFYVGYMDARSKSFMETAEAAISGLKSGAITEAEAESLYRSLIPDEDTEENVDEEAAEDDADDDEKGGE